LSTATCTGPAATITEARLYFPATQRNRKAIWDVLGPLVAENRGPILEVASGSGQHLAYFQSQSQSQSQSPAQQWQGSDPEPAHRASILAWNPELSVPLDLDVRKTWPPLRWGGIIAINLLHISPWEATVGLLRGAAEHLVPEGWLYIYGAFLRQDAPNAPSNLAFDQDLKAQNGYWGVRDLEEVRAQAAGAGLDRGLVVNMPANNFSLVFRLK
jgi:hypothetical protein